MLRRMTIRFDRTSEGKLAAWIFPADRNLLRRCSDRFVADFGAQQLERFDGMDQIFWDFSLSDSRLVLHWHQQQGIALLAGDVSAKTEELVRRVAEHLATRVTI